MFGNYFEPSSSDMFLINDKLREFVIILIPYIHGFCFIYTIIYFYSQSQTLPSLGLLEQMLARVTISWSRSWRLCTSNNRFCLLGSLTIGISTTKQVCLVQRRGRAFFGSSPSQYGSQFPIPFNPKWLFTTFRNLSSLGW